MTGYTRQEIFISGDIIEAAHGNNEFNQVVAAFAQATGHKHNGTAAEGAFIPVISNAANTDKVEIVTGGAKTTGTHQVTGVITADVGVTATTNGFTATAGDITATAGNVVLTAGNVTLAALATVDGRDVSVDGTKLDGIETAATTDQTGAEIKTAYQAEANAFTDAQFTKLAGIEAAATADQTAAEVVFTATGNIVATDVQAAIAEVDTEKAALAGATFTGAVTVPGFTSTGINDDATSEKLQISDAFIQIGSDGSAPTLDIKAVNSAAEGAQINLSGSASNDNWVFDISQNDMRFFPNSASTNEVKFFNAGAGQVNLSTDGTITCGTFTSTGIDDNATGERLQLTDTEMVLGASGDDYDITRNVNDRILFLSGGNGASSGANIALIGGTHATLANDIKLRSGSTDQLAYDDSASLWDFQANDITTTGTASTNKIVTPNAGNLTIAAGVITVTGSFHRVDTEAAASTDDLNTINGFEDGMQLFIRPFSGANTVVVKDATGNLSLSGDFSMDSSEDILQLIYTTAGNKWLEVSRSNNFT
jgi:hypothetical protein